MVLLLLIFKSTAKGEVYTACFLKLAALPHTDAQGLCSLVLGISTKVLHSAANAGSRTLKVAEYTAPTTLAMWKFAKIGHSSWLRHCCFSPH